MTTPQQEKQYTVHDDHADPHLSGGDDVFPERVNMHNNVSGRIQNPLAGISHDLLMSQVAEFAERNLLSEHTALLQKGALVAQDPARFEQVEGLTDVEVEALRDEVIHKWRQPYAMYFTVILCSIGAAVQGWDQTGSNGANLSWPVALNVNDARWLNPPTNTILNPDFERNGWIVGMINASIVSLCSSGIATDRSQAAP